jgi:hypothetical protein
VGAVITVATLLWQSNKASRSFSQCYDESWVEKLFRGFRRNLSYPFQFVLFTDEKRHFAEPLEQIVVPGLGSAGYSDCIRPYSLANPMILTGLDTVITGSVDHLADYCLNAEIFALPRDPYRMHQACNGVALVPAGHEKIYSNHNGENDMEWVRKFPHCFIDDLFPGHVQSYKGWIKRRGLRGARIVYFHGEEKPHQLQHLPLIQEHWI